MASSGLGRADNKSASKSDGSRQLDVPSWASQWSTFLSRLHNRELVLTCPDCNGPATVRPEHQDTTGIMVHCDDTQRCDHYELVLVEEMLEIVGMGGDR